MTNKKYVKGRSFEYKLRTFFRRKGYFVVRAAGSKGPADLVAVKKGVKTLLIQAKTGSGGIGVEEQNTLFQVALESGGVPIVALSEDRKPTVFKRITGMAVKTGDESLTVRSSEF